MTSLIDRIQHLINVRQEIGQPIEQHFLPGLSREEIAAKVASFPFYFPEELIELYAWHNGMENEDFLLFRDCAWLSLDNAIHEYEEMLRYFWPEVRDLGIQLEPEKLFPFAGYEGMYLYLTYPDQQECPKVDLPIFGVGGDGVLDPYFASLESMLDTVEEWYSVGEHSKYACEVDLDLELQIWHKHNSDVLSW